MLAHTISTLLSNLSEKENAESGRFIGTSPPKKKMIFSHETVGAALCLLALLLHLHGTYTFYPLDLNWNAIKWAEENGFRYVCFGSTPAHPKSAREKANYSQKVMFGGSFLQQETVFIPFDSYAFAILSLGSKAVKAWKAIRNALPEKLQRTMKRRLYGIF